MYRNLCRCTSKIMRHIKDDTNIYDTSDEAIGIEAKVEVDIRS